MIYFNKKRKQGLKEIESTYTSEVKHVLINFVGNYVTKQISEYQTSLP
jgi:hypothetical protein